MEIDVDSHLLRDVPEPKDYSCPECGSDYLKKDLRITRMSGWMEKVSFRGEIKAREIVSTNSTLS